MTDLVEQVKEALEGATPGRWEIDRPNDLGMSSRTIAAIGPCRADEYAGLAWLDVSETDARLIALAPAMARALIAQEERLKAAEKLAGAVQAEAIAATLELNDPKNGERILQRREKRAALGEALAAYRAAKEAGE